jgi:hypothetical protein
MRRFISFIHEVADTDSVLLHCLSTDIHIGNTSMTSTEGGNTEICREQIQ